LPDSNSQPQQQGSQAPIEEDQGGGYVFKKEVEEVVLHAIVTDQTNRLVTNLQRASFTVSEDGKAQQMTFFRHEDVPVALGILVDNSGSMRPMRPKLSEAALKLVESSQVEDRVFVVNFGDDSYLDQDFTGDVAKLKAALERTETQGSTALYDAVVASAEHLAAGAPHEKKILLILTDGVDNSSQETLTEALHRLQKNSSPVIYAIALPRENSPKPSGSQAIRTLCEQSGGSAFFPNTLDEVKSIAASIARDIRSQYVIGYKSSNPGKPGAYHRIAVQATDSAGDVLRVSTRSGYYAGSADATQ
jgi:VWFA-related protein